jgi:lipoprotein-anchoring transpeptidase ErfK/SrfK
MSLEKLSSTFKESHIVFKSSEPKGSAFWYPDTPINYAAEYHSGGFFYHDATWRVYFGPGANLPHADYSSGEFSDDGTHGCINMQLSQAQWLYNWLDVGTPTIIF